MTFLVLLLFFCGLNSFIYFQTIAWMQQLKAGPVRTSSDRPDCPPTLPSRTPNQSVTTIPTPVPQRVANPHFSLQLISVWQDDFYFVHFALEQSITASLLNFLLSYLFTQPIGCQEDASQQEEMKRAGVTVFKE